MQRRIFVQRGQFQFNHSVLRSTVRRGNAAAAGGASSTVDNFPMKTNFKPLRTPQYGVDILHDALWNKGTAFAPSERERLGLRGLLPPTVRTIEDQAARVRHHINSQDTAEKKNLYLQDLHNRNETLYFKTLVDDIENMAPLVYTPTVGQVCLQFGNQFLRPRGMYFSKHDRGYMSSMVHNWPHNDVHVIVVTDGSRILGLGDLGVNGMGIPIGKLALYCAAGGIAPHRVLPITIDVGTNNQSLLDDPNYLGIREKRISGQEYYDVMDEFMAAVFNRWPNVMVQFEDFETPKAVPLLARYREKYRMFNDDIQGTGSVTLSGLLSAVRNSGGSIADLKVLCVGAGSAGLGVCSQIVDGMVKAGMTREDAMNRFVICASKGVIGKEDGKFGNPNHARGLDPSRKEWVNKTLSDGLPLVDAVKQFKPTVLLGLSTVPNIFTEEVIKAMDQVNTGSKPIIMPMSNPTSKSECTPEQAYNWTNGRAVVATGSPFQPVKFKGQTFVPSQCNNMYIFPGVGLACSVAGVTKITDDMLYIAAKACTESMTPEEIDEGRTFPRLNRIREVSINVAVAIIKEAIRLGLAPKLSKKEKNEVIESLVRRKMYFPLYAPLVSNRR